MGKKQRGHGPTLGGLADALVKAGVASEREANRSKVERVRERKELGREGLEAQEREREAARTERQRQQRDQAREREQQLAAVRDEESARNLIRSHRDTSRGNKRWFFVARDGRVPFVEVSDAVMRQLTDGQAGVVESLGCADDEHVVLTQRAALAALHEHDPELVRFWNS